MSTREKIVHLARKGRNLRTSDLVKLLGITRQSVASQLKQLVEGGLLVKTGATRAASYRLAGKGQAAQSPPELKLVKKLKGLEEDRVLNEVVLKLGLKNKLNKNALSIFSYAFTEMLNNAIDHSQGNLVKITVTEAGGEISFDLQDSGIGIFQKIRRKFHLESEYVALEHVLKGKQTTAPEAHSGEGIFFTSRIADRFALRSHRLRLRIDNRIPDTFVAEEKTIRGTTVSFSISKNTKKRLDTLFAKHTNVDFLFDRADQRIKVATFGGSLSRSQAKRLLSGLDQFDRLTFDFRGVKEIGQGFADEMFRIYARANPQKKLDYINAVGPVAFMIRRAQGEKA